ncbi:MAG TPA: type I-U CRISPR-associated helicase/endonuclease Cas3 [Longimicrobiales bacterium]|nr:type I-U CRISPR-associated helicase/endonuclease Cas3 [Longimicrobiales bacterium]
MNPSDFAAFFDYVHGRAPFPWQIRLAEQVLGEGRWPEVLDLPTGVGKTSAIDVALFALALRPDVFPRRIVLVVDRRVVVDQGAEHARRIRTKLMGATGGVGGAVAAALRTLSGGGDGDEPFDVSVLRGGMPRDETWARRPDRAVVALSTVDQVGSRLLFRGYGVSPRMAPVHAGLLGNDTLILLDEVQLSTAFADTLGALHRRWRGWRQSSTGTDLPDRWGVVRMSATPLGDDNTGEGVFRLNEADRRHALLSQRLGARKMTTPRLVAVSGDAERRAQTFAVAAAEEARAHVGVGAGTVAVVVNRVDTARRVHRILHGDPRRPCDVALLTGRMRPLDRMDHLGYRDMPGTLAHRISAGRLREQNARPLIVVATQCIEAGADFDFDGMVTECASLDALRQRLGRLDRLGQLGVTRCTVLARADQVKPDAEDPIYGGALAATWAWLVARTEAADEAEGLDLGIAGFPNTPEGPEALGALCSRVVRAPVLLPAHLDAWVQTNPRPEPEPEVALWLHGPRRDAADVQIVWRADLDAELLNANPGPTGDQRDVASDWAAQFDVCPPSSLECISVPIHAARAWLSGHGGSSFGDVEGASDDDSEVPGDEVVRRARRCVRLGRRGPEIVEARDLRPGDTLIVPSTYGGIGHGTWDPGATAFVADLGDWAQLVHRGRPTLRLVREVLGGPDGRGEAEAGSGALQEYEYWCSHGLARSAPGIVAGDGDDTDRTDAVDTWINAARAGAGARLKVILDALAPPGSSRGYRQMEIAGGRVALLATKRVDPRRFLHVSDGLTDESPSEDDDSGSFADRNVTLRRHLRDVEGMVVEFCRNLGLSSDVVSDLALAGALHDVGKADPRFQRMLAGGSEVRLALQDEPLAKSSGAAAGAAAREQARKRSGYPDGYRHELLSVAMLDGTPAVLADAKDRDLVLHLVGSHHGWCRPFAPAVDPGPPRNVEFAVAGTSVRADAAHSLARLDSGVADRFWDLVERYGWWGLAWLESIVRLADHRASEAEGRVIST